MSADQRRERMTLSSCTRRGKERESRVLSCWPAYSVRVFGCLYYLMTGSVVVVGPTFLLLRLPSLDCPCWRDHKVETHTWHLARSWHLISFPNHLMVFFLLLLLLLLPVDSILLRFHSDSFVLLRHICLSLDSFREIFFFLFRGLSSRQHHHHHYHHHHHRVVHFFLSFFFGCYCRPHTVTPLFLIPLAPATWKYDGYFLCVLPILMCHSRLFYDCFSTPSFMLSFFFF